MKHSSKKCKPIFIYNPVVFIYFQMKDPDLQKYISGFAIHLYSDMYPIISPTSFLDKAHRQYPDKFILYTEASISKYLSCCQLI